MREQGIMFSKVAPDFDVGIELIDQGDVRRETTVSALAMMKPPTQSDPIRGPADGLRPSRASM